MTDHLPALNFTFAAIWRLSVLASLVWIIGDAVEGGSQSPIAVPLLVGAWACLSTFSSQHASNDAVDGPRLVGPRHIFPAVTLRERAMSPVSATLPVVAAATMGTVKADGHTVG
jgi:hypothetical protein